jgi:hypothetical protein
MILLRFADGLRLAVAETPPDRFTIVPGCEGVLRPAPWIAVSGLLRYR